MPAPLPADPAVAELVAACRSLAEEAFGARLLGVYLIGSLGHGGFSPAVSDVGVAFLLDDPLTETDAEQISALAAYCGAAHPRYGRRLSLFWSSPDAFTADDRVQVAGRFPAIDRLDLLSHGQLIARDDLRPFLALPTRRAVLENCREDALRFVRDPARYGFLTGGGDYDFGDRRALSRLCLFPARFLHTAATGEVVANDVAAAPYLADESDPAAVIAALGLMLRRDPQRELMAEDVALLREQLPDYYRRFLIEFLNLLGARPPAEATTSLLLAALDQSGG
jgi:hypothetical protein